MTNRPPIVVLLGHVDHGKTSLLDALLKTSVAATEAGGITQSTRAFQAAGCTFIDTPGHEAFSQMRSRGSRMADIALLIISGVDGVMPQTKESISAIAAAGIPFIAVVTKADLADFNLDKIKTQLAENQVLVEGYGGDVPLAVVSAKTGQGLVELLELTHLVNQLHPTSADPDAPGVAVVLESRLDAKRGPVAVVVIKDGSFAVGQNLFVGTELAGKAKALTATSGERLAEAGPSTPVEILGLTQVVPVGVVITPQVSSITPELRSSPLTLRGETGELKIILKADALGSLEAIQAALPPAVAVLLAATGEVSESDVLLAQVSGVVIVGFNVRVPASAAKLAEVDKVKIITAKIIYELLEQVEQLLQPRVTEKVVGRAQVLAEFKIGDQRVAGCKCVEGEITKSAQIKVGEKLTRIKSLRTGKVEVESVKPPGEFGAVFSPAVDFKLGEDIIAVENG